MTTKVVEFKFECAHCGKKENVIVEEVPADERVDASQSFPKGWVGVHGHLMFSKLQSRIKGANKYDKKQFDIGHVAFCGMNCACGFVITDIEKIQTCD